MKGSCIILYLRPYRSLKGIGFGSQALAVEGEEGSVLTTPVASPPLALDQALDFHSITRVAVGAGRPLKGRRDGIMWDQSALWIPAEWHVPGASLSRKPGWPGATGAVELAARTSNTSRFPRAALAAFNRGDAAAVLRSAWLGLAPGRSVQSQCACRDTPETNSIRFDAFDEVRLGRRSFGIFQCQTLQEEPDRSRNEANLGSMHGRCWGRR